MILKKYHREQLETHIKRYFQQAQSNVCNEETCQKLVGNLIENWLKSTIKNNIMPKTISNYAYMSDQATITYRSNNFNSGRNLGAFTLEKDYPVFATRIELHKTYNSTHLSEIHFSTHYGRAEHEAWVDFSLLDNKHLLSNYKERIETFDNASNLLCNKLSDYSILTTEHLVKSLPAFNFFLTKYNMTQ